MYLIWILHNRRVTLPQSDICIKDSKLVVELPPVLQYYLRQISIDLL
jgi:hypothetical protein